MNFAVYQPVLSDEMVDAVNAAGWHGVSWGKAYMKLTSCMNKVDVDAILTAADARLYEHTMSINGAASTEDAFAVGNGVGSAEKLDKISPLMKSMSVGDILVDTDTNEAFVCLSYGFGKLHPAATNHVLLTAATK